MKRFVFTVSISLVAFAVAAAIAYSRAQQGTALYLGTNGWTLKRDIIFTLPSGESRRVGRDVKYFAADGRRRDVSYHIKDDGTETCENVVVYIPGRGAFYENSRDQRLVYIEDYTGWGGYVDINLAHKDPNYVSDQQILSYNCAFTRNVASDGTITEYYEGYNFARFPLKKVSRSNKGIQTWEPTAIELGEVPESALAYQQEWLVDFGEFEKRIQRTQSANPSDPQYTQQAERLRQQLKEAKRRLSKQYEKP